VVDDLVGAHPPRELDGFLAGGGADDGQAGHGPAHLRTWVEQNIGRFAAPSEA
jgi:hypothetical protein